MQANTVEQMKDSELLEDWCSGLLLSPSYPPTPETLVAPETDKV